MTLVQRSATAVPMPPDTHGMNAGRTMTMQERRRARRRWRRRTRPDREIRRLAAELGVDLTAPAHWSAWGTEPRP